MSITKYIFSGLTISNEHIDQSAYDGSSDLQGHHELKQLALKVTGAGASSQKTIRLYITGDNYPDDLLIKEYEDSAGISFIWSPDTPVYLHNGDNIRLKMDQVSAGGETVQVDGKILVQSAEKN